MAKKVAAVVVFDTEDKAKVEAFFAKLKEKAPKAPIESVEIGEFDSRYGYPVFYVP